jgi:hypothetical protein
VRTDPPGEDRQRIDSRPETDGRGVVTSITHTDAATVLQGESLGKAVPLQTLTGGEPAVVAVVAGTFFVGLFVAYLGYSRYQTSQLIGATERAPIGSVTKGRTAISGTVHPVEESLDRPFTDGKCVRYSFSVKDLVETDDEDDVDGDREWKRVEKGSDEVPYYVEGEAGTALVAIEDGPSYTISSDNRERLDHGDGLAGLSNDTIPNDVITREYRETVVPVGEDVCVLGGARRSTDAGADVVIGTDDESGLFMLTDGSKENLARSMSITGPLAIVGGLAVSAVMLGILLNDFVLV